MTHRNNYGAHTIAILTALEERGTCTARQVTDATGLEYDTARQYLPLRIPWAGDGGSRWPGSRLHGQAHMARAAGAEEAPSQAEAGNHGGKGNRPRSGSAHDLDELKGRA